MNSKLHQAEIIKLLTPYLSLFPHSEVDSLGLVIYAKSLTELSLAQIEVAMLKLIRKVDFFPTVHQIFEEAKNIDELVNEKSLPTAEEAWGEAMEQVRKNHIYKEWQYSCDEVKEAVKLFGITELCSLKSEEVGIARAQFTKFYNSVVKRNEDKILNGQILASLPEKTLKDLKERKQSSLIQVKDILKSLKNKK